jgi:hypothetical protein
MTLKALQPLPEKTEKKEPAASEATALPPITQDTLLSLIASMQQQLLASQQAIAEMQKNQNEANHALADAIIETTKPRERLKTKKEIAQEKNDELFQKNEKELDLRKKANVEYTQSLCDHIAGCSELSEQRDIAGRTSIGWHRNDIGVDIGICSVCQRIFRPEDPDYAQWRKKPSFNKLSQAGHRNVMNPVEAREQSYLHDIE